MWYNDMLTDVLPSDIFIDNFEEDIHLLQTQAFGLWKEQSEDECDRIKRSENLFPTRIVRLRDFSMFSDFFWG